MRIQRLGDRHREESFYEGSGELGVEHYFADSIALGVHVMHYRLDPGVSEGEHLHLGGDEHSCSADDSDELYVITAGEVVMSVDGERTVLRAGDAAYAPAGSLHGVANETDAVAELILVFGPPRG
ncbi:MAG: cupin domain-containing protein [Microbacteriaceae bacterium]